MTYWTILSKKLVSEKNSWHLQDIDPPPITRKETTTSSLYHFHWTNSRSFSTYLLWDYPVVSVFACGQIKMLSVASIQRYGLLQTFFFIVYKKTALKMHSHESSLCNKAKYARKFHWKSANLNQLRSMDTNKRNKLANMIGSWIHDLAISKIDTDRLW